MYREKSKILFVIILMLLSCQKREWNNPFDPDCPKESFTPTSFNAEQQGNVVKLTWTQSNNQISGFKIERKVAGGSWAEVASPGKSISVWNDEKLINDKLHEYRLYSYAGQNESNKISTQITPKIPPIAITLPASNVTTTSATLNGTVNANGVSTAVTFEYGETTTYGQLVTASSSPVTGSGATTVSAAISGLVAGKTYHFRVKAVSSAGTTPGSDLTFTTGNLPPAATTLAATNVTTTSATLNGTVNANGVSTTVTFEYGETTAYGQSVTASPNPVTGSSATTVGAAISGLVAGKTYHFRVKAVSSAGTTPGSDLTFTTGNLPPTVTTLAATNITITSATLNGTVNSNGVSTSLTFEYGETTAYGQSVTATPSPVTGSGATTVGAAISGLVAGKTYHFRVKAVSSAGTTHGSNLSFTTLSQISVILGSTASQISNTAALVNGSVTGIGIPEITERGFCWSNKPDPTINNNKKQVGSGSGIFEDFITGLVANTTYYVKAYATDAGNKTTYSVSQLNFVTAEDEPFINKTVIVDDPFNSLINNWTTSPDTVVIDGNPYYYWAELIGGYYNMFYNREFYGLSEIINTYNPVLSNTDFEVEAKVRIIKSVHDQSVNGIYSIGGIVLYIDNERIDFYFNPDDSLKIRLNSSVLINEGFHALVDTKSFNILKITRIGTNYDFYVNHKLFKSLSIPSLTGEVTNIGFIVSGGSQADYIKLAIDGYKLKRSLTKKQTMINKKKFISAGGIF